MLPEACGEDGNVPDIVQCRSAADEAYRVVAWMKEKYALTGRWGDIAVLCPTQFSADRLTELLLLQDIPTVISFTPAEKMLLTPGRCRPSADLSEQ